MKAVLTILFILFIGLFAQAQNNGVEPRVTAQTESVVLANETVISELNNNETKIVRLYLDKNHKVKKELSFRTKAFRSKLA
ncbi:hypothetical protein H0I23_02675 [Cellulophaga sp. HaHaR_3_176]|uniref:hypothetical protein n=1 Tax=Cellulophaga sp. HaHaR_3_176 TaxID=1942464 RepID=UPI001C1FE4FD|nr:hypothetical protein [Cellulophaga sp. HaHaR_3_176]QWX84568.1 hypothetical protein H0I23_02675 [Cellulophaga sp. HaHaR_3_176]